MQKAIRNILICIATLFLFFITDRAVAHIFQEITTQSKIRFSRIYKGNIDAKILIIGNSRGVHSFYAPDIQKVTNQKTFNLSYNGMSTQIATEFFKDYLENNSAPRLLIIETTFLRDNNNLLKNVKMYSKRSKGIGFLFKEEQPKSYLATKLSNTYAYNSEMFFRNLYYLNKTDQTWISRKVIKPDFINNAVPKSANINLPREENIEALKEMLRLCNKHGIEAKLVIAPYLPEYLASLQNFTEWKSIVAEAIDDTPLYDLSDALKDSNHFSDTLHTNYNGATELIDAMKANGIL